MRVPSVTTVFLGFGRCAEAAARTMLRRRHNPLSILVLTDLEEEAARAQNLGLLVHDSSALRSVPAARRIIVDERSAQRALASVREARAVMPSGHVLVAVDDPNERDRFLACGATEVFCPAALAGQALAESVLPRALVGSIN